MRALHNAKRRDALSGYTGLLDRHLVGRFFGIGGLPGEVGDLRFLVTAAHRAAQRERGLAMTFMLCA